MVSSQLLWRFPNLLHGLIGEIRDPPGKITGMTLNITTKVPFFNTESFRCHYLLHTKAGPRWPPGKVCPQAAPLGATRTPSTRAHVRSTRRWEPDGGFRPCFPRPRAPVSPGGLPHPSRDSRRADGPRWGMQVPCPALAPSGPAKRRPPRGPQVGPGRGRAREEACRARPLRTPGSRRRGHNLPAPHATANSTFCSHR